MTTTRFLQGKRALITGSVQGIGLAIATALAREGCAVVLHGLGDAATRQAALKAVHAAGADKALCLDHNLGDPAQVSALMAQVLDAGPLDILVNNAGIQ